MKALANCRAAPGPGSSQCVWILEKAGGTNFLLSTLLLLTVADEGLVKGAIKSKKNEGLLQQGRPVYNLTFTYEHLRERPFVSTSEKRTNIC